MNNTEAFEFLLSWKDDVLMNCSVTDPEIYRQVSAWFTDLLRKS